MTEQTATAPAVVPTPPPGRAAARQLARLEAGRMLRHPAPWIGLALAAYMAHGVMQEQTWASAQYQGLLASTGLLLLGISLATVSVFGREQVPLAPEAPLDRAVQSWARLVAGLSLVGMVALVTTGAAIWLRVRGGLPLGDEPGHTEHAYYSLPELVQPALLAAFAVALGAAVVHLVRKRLVASIVLVVTWFLVGPTYWVLNAGAGHWLTPLQVQPIHVEVGPATADPTTFPADWLLSVPGEHQAGWDRLVVSPALAGWHDAYLLGITALAVAVAVPGRTRRVLLPVGLIVAVAAVLLQRAATP